MSFLGGWFNVERKGGDFFPMKRMSFVGVLFFCLTNHADGRLVLHETFCFLNYISSCL